MTYKRRPTRDCKVCGKPTISNVAVHSSHVNAYMRAYYDANFKVENGWQWAEDREARKKDVKHLRAQGMTYQAIADKYDISRQRVHQILREG
jgi:hypothetical protein